MLRDGSVAPHPPPSSPSFSWAEHGWLCTISVYIRLVWRAVARQDIMFTLWQKVGSPTETAYFGTLTAVAGGPTWRLTAFGTTCMLANKNHTQGQPCLPYLICPQSHQAHGRRHQRAGVRDHGGAAPRINCPPSHGTLGCTQCMGQTVEMEA